MKKLLAVLLGVMMLVSFAACDTSNNSGEGETITITDMTGREVTLSANIESYAISTMDVIDFIIPLLGEEAFEKLVGVGNSGGKDAYDAIYNEMFPYLEDQVGIISEHNAPFDLEVILAQAPDVLIVNSAMRAHTYALEIENELTEAGIALVLIDVPADVDSSVQDAVTLMGTIFGEETQAETVCDFISDQFAIVSDANLDESEEQPTVYYEKSGTSENFGPTSLSTSSGWGAVVAYAGGNNIADDNAKGDNPMSVTLDPEYVLNADPDYIILSGVNSLGYGADESLLDSVTFDIAKRSGWGNLTAVQSGNVYEFQHELSRTICSFYPTLKIAKVLYPETFTDVDPEATLEAFYDEFMLIDADSGIWILQMQ